VTFEEHLDSPRGTGALRDAGCSGAAGGGACGDLIRIAVDVADGRIAAAGFDAEGCGAMTAAGSAVVTLVQGAAALDAARLTPDRVSGELGGLVPGKRHAAVLAADALHRALGVAARRGAIRLAPQPRRTLVAMSGGVDSAVAARLALDAGDEVVAVTLELWSDPATDGERSCCSPQAVTGARALAHELGLPHLTLDLRERFRAEVVDDFLAGYADGRTPNPCVRCNGFVRFDAMLELAGALGAGRLATGHYARIAQAPEGPLVRAAVEERKDQSYMLARLRPDQLARLSFPLGSLTKDVVRALAREAGLPVADKRESQDLCFVAGLGGADFLRRHGGRRLGRRPGELVRRDGTVVGRHEGQHRFTVGQRKGLGVSGEEPLFVLAKDARANRVTVGTRAELATTTVPISDLTLHRPAEQVEAVRLRYHGPALPCELSGSELRLREPARAVAPGQAAVLLRGDAVVGEATIAGHG